MMSDLPPKAIVVMVVLLAASVAVNAQAGLCLLSLKSCYTCSIQSRIFVRGVPISGLCS